MFKFCDAFLPYFGCLGAPFDLILPVLGRFWASFWLSWEVLGHLFGPSWPKLAQDSEKNRFSEFGFLIWDQVGTQVGTQVGPRPSKIEAET